MLDEPVQFSCCCCCGTYVIQCCIISQPRLHRAQYHGWCRLAFCAPRWRTSLAFWSSTMIIWLPAKCLRHWGVIEGKAVNLGAINLMSCLMSCLCVACSRISSCGSVFFFLRRRLNNCFDSLFIIITTWRYDTALMEFFLNSRSQTCFVFFIYLFIFHILATKCSDTSSPVPELSAGLLCHKNEC